MVTFVGHMSMNQFMYVRGGRHKDETNHGDKTRNGCFENFVFILVLFVRDSIKEIVYSLLFIMSTWGRCKAPGALQVNILKPPVDGVITRVDMNTRVLSHTKFYSNVC
jgi:hypothetical protein